MLRVGVISDTHGSLSTAVKAIQQMGAIEALIHAGDLYTDALSLNQMLKVPVYAVTGNCDAPHQGPEELIITLGGYKIFITHGHFYRAKSTLQLLCYRSQELEAQVVVFGHTHVPINIWEDNLCLFNPGSTSRPPSGIQPGYGVLDLRKEEIKGELYSLPDL